MAVPNEWEVEYLTHDWDTLFRFNPIDPVVTFKYNDPSTFSCEIPLSLPELTRDIIGAKRTDFRLWRGNNLILEGEVREVGLSNERDTVAVEHADYLEYLNDRIYPYHYPWTYGDWPKKWVAKDLTFITEAILQDMVDDDPYCPPYIFNNSNTGNSTNYQIDAGNFDKILEHIKTLSDREDGFDFKARRDGNYVRFHIEAPSRDLGYSIYTLDLTIGQITHFQWTNTGPDGTWNLGVGAGSQNKSRASEWSHLASRQQFRRRDNVKDFGNVRNMTQLEKLSAAENHRALFPQKNLEMGLLVNTAHLPDFWNSSEGYPYNLLGRRIWVGPIDFKFHTVDAQFKVLDMTVEPDEDGNEWVTFGLDMFDG